MKKFLLGMLVLSMVLASLASCDYVQITKIEETKVEEVKLPVSTAGLEMKLNSDNKGYTVVGIGDCTATELVIGTYEGLPVTAVATKAFEGNEQITSVVFGDCVVRIGVEAFSGCTALESATLSKGLTVMDYCSFGGCTMLKTLVIPEGVVGLGYAAFIEAGITEITIPSTVTNIGVYAFGACTNLTTIRYNGTKAEWEKILKNSGWDEETGAVEIKCTDGSITKPSTLTTEESF